MKLRSVYAASFLLAAVGLAGPASTPLAAQSGAFRIHAPGVAHAIVDSIHGDLAWSEERIAGYLGVFPDTASVQIFPNRHEFSAALRDAWGLSETACWMVGGADDRALFLLSPAVWGEEA